LIFYYIVIISVVRKWFVIVFIEGDLF
jgi:hypothetical protein